MVAGLSVIRLGLPSCGRGDSDSMEVVEFPLNQIKIKFRLRNPSPEKVEGIAHSIEKVGLINPVTIDGDGFLLAGYHRVLAHQTLGRDTIPTIVKQSDHRMSELIELDENLQRNELNRIEESDHINRREELFQDLGLTYKQGDNRWTKEKDKLTIEDLAKGIGISKRGYQLRKQVASIHPEVKSLLVETEWADNLVDLVNLSKESDEIQKRVCDLLITGKCSTWKTAFYEAKLTNYKLESPSKFDFSAKERWGLPQSLMKFKKVNNDLAQVVKRVNDDVDLRHIKSTTRFGLTPIRLHQMNPEQCHFALDYYTNEGDLICDPFQGRGTTAITSLYLKRRFIGFEINEISAMKTRQVIEENLDVPSDHWKSVDGCGVEMKEMEGQEEILDGVFSSPPYYRKAEGYTDDSRDLCNLSVDQFDQKIDQLFGNLKRLIKTSNYEMKVFKPIIFVVGTSRRGKEGILDMSFTFQRIAKDHGLTLWDQMFVELNNPFLVPSLGRNYENRFVQKNYESQLVFVKF